MAPTLRCRRGPHPRRDRSLGFEDRACGEHRDPGPRGQANSRHPVGLRKLDDAPRCIPRMEGLGYEYVPEYEKELPMRRYFRKGPRENRTHHVHMVEDGRDFWVVHLRFRDFLRDHPDDARRYELLKRELVARFENDREAYTASKAEFIKTMLSKAAEAGY